MMSVRHTLPSDRQRVLDAILRADLVAFIQKVFGTVCPEQPFSPNWHIEAIAYSLLNAWNGQGNYLIVTVPPRHLKSIIASVALPAFILGHDPTRRIICVSYSQDLSVKHGNDCRAVVNSDWYQNLFPFTRIDPAKNTEAEFATTARGFRLATSIGGTLTGRGGNLVIIDDPIKPTDAMSKSARDQAIEWCSTTLLTRLDDKTNDTLVLVMQRLHVDDPAGHFLRSGGWDHLNLPAMSETESRIRTSPNKFYTRKAGELLHPAREPQQVLDRLRTSMGSANFSAQYLQSPIPKGGNMINWEWIGTYEPHAEAAYDSIVISWDTALKSTQLSDYSVGTVWGIRGDFSYLLDLIRVKLDFPNLRRKVIETYRAWAWYGATLLIEDAGSGTSLLQELRAENIPAIAIKAVGDKVMRMNQQSAKIEAGAVFVPTHAPWLDELRSELLAFPYGSHDDQVDSISQALAWVSRPRPQLMFG
jgi:predicted phage terminase large subunit-like protein